MKIIIQFVAIVALAFAPMQHIQATLYNTALDFNASSQSFWGPNNPSISFGSSGSWGLGPFDFSYDIGASTGTVSSQFGGNLFVDYTPVYSSVFGSKSVNLGLSFLGNNGGGQIKSDLGAWVNVNALGLDLLDIDYALNINKKFTPKIDSQVSGSDSVRLGETGVNVIVAKVDVEFDIQQTNNFEVNSINGLLGYTLRGSGVSNSTAFSLDNADGLSLDLDLGSAGTWDFWFINMTLDNTFSTSFDANLILSEEHINGIRSCKKCVWGLCVRIPCGFDYDTNEITLASINVFDGTPFPLNFNSISSTENNGFSINVLNGLLVPEPPIFLLLLLAGLSVLGFRKIYTT